MKQSASALSRPQVTMDSDSVPHTTQHIPQPKTPQETFVEVAAADIGPSFTTNRPAEDFNT